MTENDKGVLAWMLHGVASVRGMRLGKLIDVCRLAVSFLVSRGLAVAAI